MNLTDMELHRPSGGPPSAFTTQSTSQNHKASHLAKTGSDSVTYSPEPGHRRAMVPASEQPSASSAASKAAADWSAAPSAGAADAMTETGVRVRPVIVNRIGPMSRTATRIAAARRCAAPRRARPSGRIPGRRWQLFSRRVG